MRYVKIAYVWAYLRCVRLEQKQLVKTSLDFRSWGSVYEWKLSENTPQSQSHFPSPPIPFLISTRIYKTTQITSFNIKTSSQELALTNNILTLKCIGVCVGQSVRTRRARFKLFILSGRSKSCWLCKLAMFFVHLWAGIHDAWWLRGWDSCVYSLLIIYCS